MANSDELRSFLKDVTLDGVGVMDKRKLLWLLGWGQDRPGAWKDLLDHWENIGQERDTLAGIEVFGPKICLFFADPKEAGYVTSWEK